MSETAWLAFIAFILIFRDYRNIERNADGSVDWLHETAAGITSFVLLAFWYCLGWGSPV